MTELSKDTNKKDPAAVLADNNPCPLCKPFKVPVCPKHGSGGGGGGSGGGESEDNKKETVSSLTNESSKGDVLAYLQESKDPYWHPVSALDKTLICIKPDALLSLTLKSGVEEGVLLFRGNKELSAVDQKTLHDFFDHIVTESEKFKKEHGISDRDFIVLFNKKDNTLTLTIANISGKDHFNLFVKQLMSNNLIPAPNNLALSQEARQESRFHPKPYDDISKGPRPKGWKEE